MSQLSWVITQLTLISVNSINLNLLRKLASLVTKQILVELWFHEKNCQKIYKKNRENGVVLHFLVGDSFDFTRKIVKMNYWQKTLENVSDYWLLINFLLITCFATNHINESIWILRKMFWKQWFYTF